MKKNIKYIVITLVALAVLGGAMAALILTNASEEKPSISTNTDFTKIIDVAKDDIVSMEVENSYGSFNYVRDYSENPEREFYIEGYEDYTIKSEIITQMNTIHYILATKDLGEVEDKTVYGFDGENDVKVTYYLKDGSTDVIYIGSDGGKTSGKYILKGDEVYIARSEEFYFQSVLDVVDGYAYTEAEFDSTGNEQPSFLHYLNVTGANFPEEIKVSANPETGKVTMTAPYEIEIPASADLYGNLRTQLTTLILNDIAVLNATEEDLAECGLDDPMIKIAFKLNDGEEHTLWASQKTVDNKRYIIADDMTETIYMLPKDSIAIWAETSLTELRSGTIFITTVTDVENLSVKYNSDEYEFNFARTKDEENSKDDAIVYTYDVTSNGKSLVYKDVTAMYSKLIGVACIDANKPENISDTASLTITYDYYEGDSNTIEYFKADNSYAAFLNGTFIGTSRASSIDTDVANALALMK